MQQDQMTRYIKAGERKTANGILVEDYCTIGGPSVETCMNKVLDIAFRALARK